MKKFLVGLTLSFSFGQLIYAQSFGPKLSEDQRACLENEIGRPGEGSRPSPEAMEAAFEKCAIDSPSKGSMRHRGPQLSDEQRACLESHMGQPKFGQRPSREDRDRAMSDCGIERPEPPHFGRRPPLDFESLKEKYIKSDSPEEREKIREVMKKLFYSSNDQEFKNKIRTFFKENPLESISQSTYEESVQ